MKKERYNKSNIWIKSIVGVIVLFSETRFMDHLYFLKKIKKFQDELSKFINLVRS